MATDTWTVASAKARFSELLDRARTHGPQTVTKNGRVSAVVVSAAEWAKKVRREGTLADFFASSPLRGSEMEVTRAKDPPRDIRL